MKKSWPILIIFSLVLLAFYPAWAQGKIPLNGRNLAAFYSPWLYQKFEGFPTGVPSKPGMPDQLRLYYPYMYLTQQMYRRLELPLWNPHNFAGNPHMAEMQSGVFYPLHILLLFLPLPIYWTLFQITGFFLAGLFTYLYLRSLQLTKLPAFFGATTFMLSTFMFTWNQEVVIAPHSILWLPLMLLAIDKFNQHHDKRWWFVGLAGLCLSVLSGYWQTTFYVMGASLAYILWRRAWLLLSWYPLSLGLTAFQLLPTAELYQLSSRPIVNNSPQLLSLFKDFLLRPFHAILLLIPDFFGHPTTRNFFANPAANYYELALFVGTIPLVFALTAVLTSRGSPSGHPRGEKWFFTILGIVAASFVFDLPHSRAVYDWQIPVLSTGIAHRILFLPAFALAVVSAFGLEYWSKAKKSLAIWTTAAGIGAVFGGVFIFLYRVAQVPDKYLWPFNPKLIWWPIAWRNSIIPAGVFILFMLLMLLSLKAKRYFHLLAITIVVLATAQNLYQFFKFTPFSEDQFIYPSHPTIKFLQENAGLNRYIGYHGSIIGSNFATYYGLYTIEGFDSLNEHLRTQLIYSTAKGELERTMARSADAILDRDYTNIYPRRILSLMGVKYLIDYPKYPDLADAGNAPNLPENEQKLIWQDGDWAIYEYTKSLPRAFLASSYIKETDNQKTADLIYDPQVNLREQLILTQDPPLALTDDPNETTDISEYRPTKITIRTSSQTNQLLFLSDTYYPGWKAAIDGQPAPVLRADLAFRAVPVPAGDHQVVMTYFPDSFRNGLVIAAMSLIVSLCVYRFWLKPV